MPPAASARCCTVFHVGYRLGRCRPIASGITNLRRAIEDNTGGDHDRGVCVFSVMNLKEALKWNYLVGFSMMVGAVFIIFKEW